MIIFVVLVAVVAFLASIVGVQTLEYDSNIADAGNAKDRALPGIVQSRSITTAGVIHKTGMTLAEAPAFPTSALPSSPGPQRGGEINAADARYAGGVISDCTVDANGGGSGTDNAPMLRSAHAAWIAAGTGAKLKVPAGQYCIGSSVDMNLNGLTGMIFDASEASIVMKNIAMVGFDFHNGLQAVIKARFVDGGVFNPSMPSAPYMVDYGAVVDVVAAGGQEAIRVSGISGYTVDLSATNYAGRLLRITRARQGEPITGGIKGTIRTTRGNSLAKPRVAQSILTDNGKNGYTGYWGHLDSLHNDFDLWGPVWYDVNDVAIGYLDGAYAYTGVVLGGVGVFKGGVIYVGDVDGNPSNTHFSFIPSPITGRLSSGLSVDQMMFLNRGNGLLVARTDPASRGADIRQVSMGASPNVGYSTVVTLMDVKGVNIGIQAEPTGDTAAVIKGSSTDDVRLNIAAKNLSNSFCYVAPEVTGNVQISGNMANPIPGRSVIVVAGDTPVRFTDLDVSASNGAALIFLQSPNNKTRWVSGSKSGAAKSYAGFPPAYVSPAIDMR